MNKYVIIGAGIAGIEAAKAMARERGVSGGSHKHIHCRKKSAVFSPHAHQNAFRKFRSFRLDHT